MDGGDTLLTGGVNPFSPTAVARVTEQYPDVVTIPTEAIRSARGSMELYLHSLSRALPAAGSRTGNVVAIVGDYGTGKTHLAVQLLHQARRAAGDRAQAMYLEAPAGSFVALYRRFVAQLGRDDVRERVRDYYADVVADALGDAPLGEVADGLRSGMLDPGAIVQNFGLMESRLQRELRRRLRGVTDNESFAVALALLLRPGFESAVWEWFSGYEPDQILRERGITEANDTEQAAIEAMGVFALLYGRRDRPFVVIVDEVDKVLIAADQSRDGATLQLKRVLQVFAAAGSYLVLAGLPDFLHALGREIEQRFGQVIRMGKLTGAEVAGFIRESQAHTFGEPRLHPFDPEIANYLVKIADGNPRRIIRLCYHLYRRATQEDTRVTEAMVRDVARRQLDVPGLDTVRDGVRRVLNNQGLPYERDQVLDALRDRPVDYWIPVGPDVGCAILISETILRVDEATALNRQAEVIRRQRPDSEVLLVVVGYLPGELADELSAAFGAEPIVYDRRSFEDDLAAAVKAVVESLIRMTGGDQLVMVRERVERLSRQQANTQNFIEQLAVHLTEMRSSAERQLALIQGELGELGRWMTASAFASGQQPMGSAHAWPPSTGSGLPAGTAELFGQARAMLGELDRFEAMLASAFRGDEPEGQEIQRRRLVIRAGLRQDKVFTAVGVAVLLQRLVRAFEEGVEEWWRSVPVGPPGPLPPAHEERLTALCRTYDAIYEFLPLALIEPITTLATGLADTDRIGEISRDRRRVELRAVFDGLGARVRRTTLMAFGDGAER
jgi:Cdc6-like AAA superfamily ATPase